MEPSRFYIVYDEVTISICTALDDVMEELAVGGILYGYTDNENMAHSLMMECLQHLT